MIGTAVVVGTADCRDAAYLEPSQLRVFLRDAVVVEVTRAGTRVAELLRWGWGNGA